MLIRKDAIHPPPIEAEEFLLNLVKIQYFLSRKRPNTIFTQVPFFSSEVT